MTKQTMQQGKVPMHTKMASSSMRIWAQKRQKAYIDTMVNIQKVITAVVKAKRKQDEDDQAVKRQIQGKKKTQETQ